MICARGYCPHIAWNVCLFLTLPACMSINRMAPPIDETFARHVGSSNGLASLEKGRRIYVTQCARCHAPEPVNRYSLSQWQPILVRMAEETKLSKTDERYLTRYIESAHAFLAWLDEHPEAKKRWIEQIAE